MMARRDPLTLVIFGPSQHGKSTLAGRLLYELGGVSQREQDKNDRDYSTYFDRTRCEFYEGHTKYSTYRQIFTNHHDVSIFVAPGKLKYKKQIGRVYSMVDLPLLVISSQGTEFEDSIDEIQQHILFMYSQLSYISTNSVSLTRPSIIVALTKWDTHKGIESDISLKRFNFLKEETTKLIGNYFQIEGFAAVSAYQKKNEKDLISNICFPYSFFSDQPKVALFSIIDGRSFSFTNGYQNDEIKKYFKKNDNVNLIYEAYFIKGIGSVFALKNICGQLKPGDPFLFLFRDDSSKTGPKRIDIKDSKVFTIERHHDVDPPEGERLFYAINSKGGLKSSQVDGIVRGSFSSSNDLSTRWFRDKPCYIVTNTTMTKQKEYKKNGDERSPLKIGSDYILISHGSQTSVKVILYQKLNKINFNNNNNNENNSVTSNDSCNEYRILFEVRYFIQLTTIPFLNRFVLMDHDNVYGMGSIDNLYYEDIIKIQIFKTAHLHPGSNLSILNDDIIRLISNNFSNLY